MAWDETTQEKYRRNAERYESDLTDAEWAVTGPRGTGFRSVRPVANMKRNGDRGASALDFPPTGSVSPAAPERATVPARVMAFRSPGAEPPNRKAGRPRTLRLRGVIVPGADPHRVRIQVP